MKGLKNAICKQLVNDIQTATDWLITTDNTSLFKYEKDCHFAKMITLLELANAIWYNTS